jgi:hypothetical protein
VEGGGPAFVEFLRRVITSAISPAISAIKATPPTAGPMIMPRFEPPSSPLLLVLPLAASDEDPLIEGEPLEELVPVEDLISGPWQHFPVASSATHFVLSKNAQVRPFSQSRSTLQISPTDRTGKHPLEPSRKVRQRGRVTEIEQFAELEHGVN